MTDPPNPLARRPHDVGDEWVYGPNGADGPKYWGRFGAAGLLAWRPGRGVLLQHRAIWSHFGGTWGLPGGARKLGESAVDAALREAAEEATVPAEAMRVMFETVSDLGYWSYTTVVAEAIHDFEPVIADAESTALRWIALDDVESYPLHPGFAASWPALRAVIDDKR